MNKQILTISETGGVGIPPSMFTDRRVLIVGDLALDRFIYGTVDRISPEAPVPVLLVGSTTVQPGCAGNVAANVAALGAQATLIGVVGNDPEAAELGSALARERGIAYRPIADGGRRTTVKTRYIADGQQVVRADQEDIHPLTPSVEDEVLRVFLANLPNSHIVIISDYNKGFLTNRILRTIIDAANAAGCPVLVDPKRVRLEDYRGATLIKPNRKELSAATGLPCNDHQSIGTAAEHAIAATGAMILLTLSEQGMSLFRKDQLPIHARTEAREVFDVSGAGDTVIAVMGAALAAKVDMAKAVRLANTAAGIVVGKLGTATVGAGDLFRALETADRGFAGRIVDLETAMRQREEWRQQGLTCGFTNGCFDLIHPGHISLLFQARRACDRLIVALNSDQSVRRLKGPNRPLQREEARGYVIASIEHVDLVVLFDEDTPISLIEGLRPDVLVKGADYREDQVIGAAQVKSWGGKVVLADLVPNQSTTTLVSRSQGSSFPSSMA